uniref:Uncharacterized protein n=1 Tax=Romanomermis culicivorax TaxID=13658 RepID=A0A915ILA4_ROMCU
MFEVHEQYDYLMKHTAVQKPKSKSKLMSTNKSGLSTGQSSKSASKMVGKFPTKSSSTTASSSRSKVEKIAFAPGDAPPTFIGGMLEPTVVPANPLMHPAPPDPEKTTVPTENSEAQEPSKIVSLKTSRAKSVAAPSVKSAASSISKAPPIKSTTVPTEKSKAENVATTALSEKKAGGTEKSSSRKKA